MNPQHFFCQNCWFTLLPHLHQCLQHILTDLTTMCIKTKDYYNYYSKEETWFHLLFLHHMIKYPFINKYIFKHKKLYKIIFKYFINTLQIVYCTDIACDKY